MRRFQLAKQAQRFLSADRAYLWAFPAEKASHECPGLPCRFTGSIPGLASDNRSQTGWLTAENPKLLAALHHPLPKELITIVFQRIS